MDDSPLSKSFNVFSNLLKLTKVDLDSFKYVVQVLDASVENAKLACIKMSLFILVGRV